MDDFLPPVFSKTLPPFFRLPRSTLHSFPGEPCPARRPGSGPSPSGSTESGDLPHPDHPSDWRTNWTERRCKAEVSFRRIRRRRSCSGCVDVWSHFRFRFQCCCGCGCGCGWDGTGRRRSWPRWRTRTRCRPLLLRFERSSNFPSFFKKAELFYMALKHLTQLSYIFTVFESCQNWCILHSVTTWFTFFYPLATCHNFLLFFSILKEELHHVKVKVNTCLTDFLSCWFFEAHLVLVVNDLPDFTIQVSSSTMKLERRKKKESHWPDYQQKVSF